jgi:hypothetical protein
MHETGFYPQTPQWSCAQLVCGVCRASLDNTIADAYVVEQEIAMGVKRLVS